MGAQNCTLRELMLLEERAFGMMRHWCTAAKTRPAIFLKYRQCAAWFTYWVELKLHMYQNYMTVSIWLWFLLSIFARMVVLLYKNACTEGSLGTAHFERASKREDKSRSYMTPDYQLRREIQIANRLGIITPLNWRSQFTIAYMLVNEQWIRHNTKRNQYHIVLCEV